MEKSNSIQQEKEPAQEADPAIEAYLNSGYDKHIKRARNILFIISGMQIVSAVLLSRRYNSDMGIAIWIEALIVAALFAGLGFWAKSNPYKAILTGIIAYISYQGLLAIIDPASIVQGIILKVLVVVFLFLGLSDAKKSS